MFYEAEDLQLANLGFNVEQNPISSGGAHISFLNPSPPYTPATYGTATGTFTGDAGAYYVNIHYYDESDGESLATVTVKGNTESFFFDQEFDPANNGVSSDTLTKRVTHPLVELQTGDTFEIAANYDLGEFARIDGIEFVPTQNPFQADGSLRYEAEKLELTGYQTESTNSTASGGEQITLSNTGFTSGTAKGIFAGAAGTYRVKVGFYDENDVDILPGVNARGFLTHHFNLLPE